MELPIEVQDAIASAAQHKDAGDPAAAEIDYFRALECLGKRDPVFRGMLYINMGTNAQNDDRLADAAAFFRLSIDLLQSERGEAHLQCAHAHYNLAHQLLTEDDPSAPAHAAEALKRYNANPFASPVDKADAGMLSFLAALFISKQADERSFTSVWQEIRGVDADELNRFLVENYLFNWLAFNHHARPENYPEVLREVHDWLGDLAAEILKSN